MPAEWTVRGRHGDRDVRVSWDPGGPGPPLRGPIDVLGAMAGVEGIEAALSPTGPFIEADLERRDGALAGALMREHIDHIEADLDYSAAGAADIQALLAR